MAPFKSRLACRLPPAACRLPPAACRLPSLPPAAGRRCRCRRLLPLLPLFALLLLLPPPAAGDAVGKSVAGPGEGGGCAGRRPASAAVSTRPGAGGSNTRCPMWPAACLRPPRPAAGTCTWPEFGFSNPGLYKKGTSMYLFCTILGLRIRNSVRNPVLYLYS